MTVVKAKASFAPQKILLVRLSALGDVVQTLPLVQVIKDHLPGVEVGWLVEEAAAVLLENHPLIDHLHIARRKHWIQKLRSPRAWPTVFSEVSSLRREIQGVHYDVAVDVQGLLKSAVLTWLMGLPNRVGLTCAREGAPWWYTQTVRLEEDFFNPQTPIFRHFLALLSAVGIPFDPQMLSTPVPLAPITAETQLHVDALLADLEPSRPVLALAPATLWHSKHWPSAYWKELLQTVLKETPLQIVVVGSKADQDLVQEILSGIAPSGRVLNLAGKTSVPDLPAVLQHANLYIGPDSAPIHLAGALQKPYVIGLYGPTSPYRTPPPGPARNRTLFSSLGDLSCQPCDAKTCPLGTTECMQRITPAMVMTEIHRVLNQSAQTTHASN